MAESPVEPERGSALLSAAEAVRASESSISSLSKAFIGGNLGPTDDTATIISKAHPSSNGGDEAMAAILRGRKLAHFELLEAIGVGGMAAVIRARDTQLDRTVALKVLPPDMASDPENVRRFQQEARAAAKLDHENIARVFYCGEDQGLHFIAFELVEGENLRTLLEKRGRLPVPEALSYVLQISTGLAHAAARSVVHRDIKPSNIVISANGRAKLVDMGLARSLETHHDGGLTQSGVTLGTFDYISPEQALEPRQADARSDIYSLGCTFYQMVTGQAPVPEGTAAKKLHHHQHVDPVDPRQLNPEISTNVALVLAKMLAKDPNDRYQHPEELVEHLIALARLEGGREEKPDGVLFVDARLPGPYIGRPVLTTCAAVAALCVLVVVLGQSPSDSSWKPPASPKGGLPNDARTVADPRENPDPENRPNEEIAGQSNPSTQEMRSYRASSGAAELAQVLKSAVSAHVRIPAGEMSLTRNDQLVFDGKDLVLEGEPAALDKKPVLRLTYDTMPPGGPWSVLTVRGGKVQIKGIRFELDAAGAEIDMSAVSRLGGTVAFENCEFVQMRAGDHGRVASVQAAGAPPADAMALVLTQCYFEAGQVAILLNSPLSVRLSQCAFGPHTVALMDVGDVGGRSTGKFDVSLVHCSAMASSESIFHCRDGVSGTFSVENCLLARIDDKDALASSTALMRQDGVSSDQLVYSGAGNVYYNLSPYYLRMQNANSVETAGSLEAFHKRAGVVDEQSQEVKSFPWQIPEPLKALDSGLANRAFRVNTTMAALRQQQSPKKPVGVEICSWGKTYSEPLPPIEPSHIAEAPWRRDEKVVDPKLEGMQEGVYRTLRQALEDARAEDVILIKHNGPLPVDSVRLERPGMEEITIRPFPGYKPILKLGNTTDSDAALFRLYDSHLRLEGMEIRLAPAGMQFKSQTVAAIMRDGKLSMKDCVVTLEEIPETPLYLVTLADPTGSGVIRMDPQPASQQEPRVHLENCFIRGAGDLLYVRSSRPFELHVENSLVALDGSFVIVDGAGKDPVMRNRSEIVLKQVTAYLTNHLVWLRASRDEGRATKGLTPTYMQSATDCIFASATGKALVHLDGFDAEEQMKRSFLWGDSKHNLYANYDQLLDQVPFTGGEMMPPTPYGRTEWGEFTKEPDVHFDRLRFLGLPIQYTSLAKVPAADFRLKSESNPQSYGAELDRLPVPADDGSHRDPR
ncbi:MAG TPA: serine/threonine-protein kinase [Gemmataceae bacterium]|jgi:serine/threonine protein kinase|nr:serine/threonine-protein kinase [Gemmataceae bacterium]